MIDSVRVDVVDLYELDTNKPGFAVHFNCFDVEGNALPGLGGYLRPDTVAGSGQWKKLADELIEFVSDKALAWIRRFDEWSDTETPITLVAEQTKLYGPVGAMGVNFQFRRGADPIVVSLLLTLGESVAMHNYKREITDTQIKADIETDVLAIMGMAEALALAINQTRSIKRRGR